MHLPLKNTAVQLCYCLGQSVLSPLERGPEVHCKQTTIVRHQAQYINGWMTAKRGLCFHGGNSSVCGHCANFAIAKMGAWRFGNPQRLISSQTAEGSLKSEALRARGDHSTSPCVRLREGILTGCLVSRPDGKDTTREGSLYPFNSIGYAQSHATALLKLTRCRSSTLI